MIQQRVPIMRTGVDLSKYLPDNSAANKPIEGVDFPKGIQHVDLQMLFDQINFESIAACKTDEELRNLRAKVEVVQWLARMQDFSRENR